jgi:hypothetical protein
MADPALVGRRVGLDLGGVITQRGRARKLVTGALHGMAELVRHLGPENVFIISRVDTDEAKTHHLSKLEQRNFFQITQMNPRHVFWTRSYRGPESKGPGPGQSELARAKQESTTVSHRLQA